MLVNFFEEYPTPENLSKLRFVDWQSLVFVAAPSRADFNNIVFKYSASYPNITFGWWPTIPGSYWVSAFSNIDYLNHLFNELIKNSSKENVPVLLDLELPIKKRIWIKNIFNVNKNKEIISKFIADAHKYGLLIYTAEYPSMSTLNYKVWEYLGLSPSFNLSHKKIPMCYSSMAMKYVGKNIWELFKNFEIFFSNKNKGRVCLGFGTITFGILGNEPILSPADLEADMVWAEKSEVDEIFIFRLGGMNNKYRSVLEKFISK